MPEIPAHTQNNDFSRELAPLERIVFRKDTAHAGRSPHFRAVNNEFGPRPSAACCRLAISGSRLRSYVFGQRECDLAGSAFALSALYRKHRVMDVGDPLGDSEAKPRAIHFAS